MGTGIKIKWRHTNPPFSHIIYWSVTEIAQFLSYLLHMAPPKGAATAKRGRPKATKSRAKKVGDRTSATIPAPVDITLAVQNAIDARLLANHNGRSNPDVDGIHISINHAARKKYNSQPTSARTTATATGGETL